MGSRLFVNGPPDATANSRNDGMTELGLHPRTMFSRVLRYNALLLTWVLLLNMGSATVAAFNVGLGVVAMPSEEHGATAANVHHPFICVHASNLHSLALEAEEVEETEEEKVGLRNMEPVCQRIFSLPAFANDLLFVAPVGSGASSHWSCRRMAGVVPCCLRLIYQVFQL